MSASTVTYNILNYDQIQRDIQTRSKIMLDYKTIIERRIKIQSQYLQKMKQLNMMPQMRKIPMATKASQFIYNSLINSIYSQIDNITNHVNRMETEISKILTGNCVQLDNQSKRQLINAGIMIKQYEKKYDEIEKYRIKMVKKAHQMRKLKQQYIVGTLIDMPFDKKNKLFIRTKQLQQIIRPLKEQYDHYEKIFNQKSAHTAQKLKQIITRVQRTEQQKVQLMKKIFMILQISNSQFGANLIQQKASILTRINQLQAANPQFHKLSQQTFEQSKKDLTIYQYDPCCYINKLFTNIIDTKNMQGLVMYGHQEKHRKCIGQCMNQDNQVRVYSDSASTTINYTQNKCQSENMTGLANVRQVVSCFKNIFHQFTDFQNEKLLCLQQLMDNSPEMRKNLILCLQKFRTQSKFDIPQNKLQHIQKILNIFLDQCLKQFDTYNSKLLLVLSFTYYVKIDDKKVDLHFFIKQHKIWKDKQWWECALLESSYQELKVKPPKKSQQVPITIWHIKGSGFKHHEGQNQMTTQNVLFNQLIFYIQNMRLFDLKEEIITYMARKYTRYFQLSAKIAADIDPFLKVNQVVIQDIQFDMMSPTNSPINLKKRGSKSRKFFLSS